MDPVLAKLLYDSKYVIAFTICVVAFFVAISITYKDQFKK